MKTTIILFLLFSGLSYSQAQWVETYGPSCGNITAFKCAGDTLYAGTQGYGIYRSTNNGLSWLGIFNNSLNDSAFINSIAVNGNNVFAATSHGIFLSTNCGLNWSAVNNGLPSNPYIRTVGVKDNKIYIGVYNNQLTVAYGVYRSVDNGSNWAPANNGISGSGFGVNCFNVCGNNLLAATNNDVYISTNDGDNWSWVDMGLVNFSVVYSIASTGSNVYSGTYEGVLYSSNSGYNWIHIGPDNWYTMTVAVSGNKLFAGVANGSSTNPVNAMYVTSNNGGNWMHMKEGVPPDVRPIVIVTNGSRVYSGLFQNGYLPLSSYPSGIYYSSDLGMTWEIRNDGIPLSSVKALAELNGTVFSGTEISNYFGLGGIQATTNEGNNWAYLDYTDSLLVGSKQFLKMSDTIYSAFPRVLKSTNLGVNWFNASNGLSGGTAYSLTSIGNNIFAGLFSNSTGTCYQCGVYKSSDFGNNWTSVTMNVTDPKVRYVKAIGSRLFAVTRYNGTFTSDDNGANWVQNTLNSYITSIEELGGLIFAGDGAGVSMSSDSGNTWTRVNSGLTSTNVLSLAKYGNLLFAGTSGGVFFTSNNGANWTDINSGFPNSMAVNTLLPTHSYLYAGTDDRGVWKYPIWTLLPSVTISGTVKYQDNNLPVGSGKVMALRYDRRTGNIIPVDSAQIQSNGQYDLLHVPQDSTFIMAYPNDEFDFVPTYYPSTTDWRQATVLYPQGNLTNIDISVFRINNSPRPYTVSGKVYKYSNNSPIKDAFIYAKQGSTYVSFGVSSSSGFYSAQNLNSGIYTLSANRIGYNPVSRDVNVVSSNLDSIDFYMLNFLVGTEPGNPVIPKTFELYQNYPNPFNPVTTIKFDLPKSGFTVLIIYDILGREVSTLVNEEMRAGMYKLQWNGSNLASGIYFFKLQSGDFVETRKMVLLK